MESGLVTRMRAFYDTLSPAGGTTPLFARCYRCFRPQTLCVCTEIPKIANRTPVLLLQHVREQRHRFNTARLVHAALDDCQLIVSAPTRLEAESLPLMEGATLLYPAPAGAESYPAARPADTRQLVVVDGTWSQAKAFLRDCPRLASLPRMVLRPEAPGQYRIRREPTPQSLSTLEAVAQALGELEPETEGLGALRTLFVKLIDRQLELSKTARWRKRQLRPDPLRHIPHALTASAQNLLVVYGESTPRTAGVLSRPLTWAATRLGTGETFRGALVEQTPEREHPASLAEHPGWLPLTDVQFALKWRRFAGDRPTLITYHARTASLPAGLGVPCRHVIALKGVYRSLGYRFRSAEELLAQLGIAELDEAPASRTDLRWAQTLALTEHLLGMCRAHQVD